MGSTVEEVAANLLVLGKIYNLEVDDEEFYNLDRIHATLLDVYHGIYPLTDILNDVRFLVFFIRIHLMVTKTGLFFIVGSQMFGIPSAL